MGTYRDELLATATALLSGASARHFENGRNRKERMDWAVDEAQALIKAVDERAAEQAPQTVTTLGLTMADVERNEASAPEGLAAPNLNRGHVAWAQGHDWYVSSSVDKRGTLRIVVRADETDKDAVAGTLTFQNLDKLRAWAGY